MMSQMPDPMGGSAAPVCSCPGSPARSGDRPVQAGRQTNEKAAAGDTSATRITGMQISKPIVHFLIRRARQPHSSNRAPHLHDFRTCVIHFREFSQISANLQAYFDKI